MLPDKRVTDMAYSKLMLGTVQFGLQYGINNSVGKPSLENVKAILRAAADGGINILDTARNYEESEEVLGIVLTRSGLDKQSYRNCINKIIFQTFANFNCSVNI
jgi:aryl-alcohol dehydrogenase-like predicted oxidoreductase